MRNAKVGGNDYLRVKPFGTYSNPYYPLPTEVLLGEYKAKGYETLWLEDLCWEWEWGLPKDLKVVNKSYAEHERVWWRTRIRK